MLTLHRQTGSNVSWDQWAAFSLGRYVANGGSPYYPNSRLDIKLNDTSTSAAARQHQPQHSRWLQDKWSEAIW